MKYFTKLIIKKYIYICNKLKSNYLIFSSELKNKVTKKQVSNKLPVILKINKIDIGFVK